MATIPEAERAASVVNIDSEQQPLERTLGIQWNVESDQFGFKIVKKDNPSTRRGILSTVSSVYDPLGFIAPFVLTAKRLLQGLCKKKIGWDDAIDDDELKNWNQWHSDLRELAKIVVTRCLKSAVLGKVRFVELHHFADASQHAYGVVSYLRMGNIDGDVHCSFLFGKSRLAPIKTITIPRLELSAATLAVKLNRMLQDELDMVIDKTVFWTDSTCVLQFINNTTSRFYTFVANRLSVIHEGSSPSQWRYVESKLNPADSATRGLTAKEMVENKQWFSGPRFLWKSEEDWPVIPCKVPELSKDDPEINSEVHAHFIAKENVLDTMISRYSSWNKLKKGFAWLIRYTEYIMHACHSQGKKREVSATNRGDLSVKEIQQAEKQLVKFVQNQVFSKEISILQADLTASENNNSTKNGNADEASVSPSTQRKWKAASSLYKLNPRLEDGLLRVGGRLANAPIDSDAKHPMILPNNHHLTDLIIEHYHRNVGHSGREHVLSCVRQRYWIIRGRVAVRRVFGRCLKCQRRNAIPREQVMADLPRCRVQPDQPPFTYVGIEYFGPLLVKQGRARVKRYGCLFTCLTIHAVHIEIAHSLDTDSFIDALRRFIARRGKPAEIRSDRGTNFQGGEREFREAIVGWNQAQLKEFLRQREIEWIFNPQAASHMGGAWERLIRSVKRILKALLTGQLVTDETLLTTMAEVELILNSRPITPNSDSPSDNEALTPNHLLLLQCNHALPPGIFKENDQYTRRRWRQAQYLANIFWRRWIKEYLPTLQKKQKWNFPQPNIKVDDLVLIAHENTPRGQWPLGRVVKVHRGSDGKVRSAVVRTYSTHLTRPVSKLCLLENVSLS